MAYIGSSPTKVVSRQSANIFTYTATANQTAFTGSDANGNTLACTPSDIMVHMNGLRLEESDYTASTTTVTLGSGAAAGDEVTITAFVTFETADAYTKSASDTRYVNATGDTMTGTLNVNGGNIYLAPDDAASHRYMFLNTGASQDGHIVLQRGLANKYQVTAATDNSYVIYSYPASGQVFNINSSGHITTPNQPCFSAGGNFGWQDVGSSYGKPTPWRTNQTGQFNSGMFAANTGRATAPVAGRYQFNLNIYTNNSGEYYHYGRLYLNGTQFADTILHLGDTSNDYPDETISGSFIVNMAANDYVEYYHVEDIYGYHSSFSGFLIG